MDAHLEDWPTLTTGDHGRALALNPPQESRGFRSLEATRPAQDRSLAGPTRPGCKQSWWSIVRIGIGCAIRRPPPFLAGGKWTACYCVADIPQYPLARRPYRFNNSATDCSLVPGHRAADLFMTVLTSNISKAPTIYSRRNKATHGIRIAALTPAKQTARTSTPRAHNAQEKLVSQTAFASRI